MSKKKRTGRNKIEKRISEFRKEHTKEAGGHPRYFFKKRGKRYYGLKLTHGQRQDGEDNVELTGNPEPKPKDKRPARIGRVIIEAAEKDLSKRLPWKFNDIDMETVNAIIKELEAEQKKKK